MGTSFFARGVVAYVYLLLSTGFTYRRAVDDRCANVCAAARLFASVFELPVREAKWLEEAYLSLSLSHASPVHRAVSLLRSTYSTCSGLDTPLQWKLAAYD